MKKLLLISNRVMHYRVSLYNYFSSQFKQNNWDFIVRSNELQKQNTNSLKFDFKKIPFKFQAYRKEIIKIDPNIVILFLHLKDIIIWPLVHWLKLKRKPVVFWTKGLNLDAPNNKLSYFSYKYMHNIFDRMILYSKHEVKYINPKNRPKLFIANNTINFNDFPIIKESKEQIKRELNIPFDKVVLFAGRMGESGGRKKVHHLIELFNSLDHRGIGLVIVGSGLSNTLRDTMNKVNTIYLGEMHDPQHRKISAVFKMADVFCVPGHIGLGLNQAFYWGLPVITEDGLQPPEIHYLVNGRNGFIVPNNDVNELKRKLLYLLQNDQVRQEFSRNAKADITAYGSIDKMFSGFKNCIDSFF